MKKIIAVLMMMGVLFSTAACGDNTSHEQRADENVEAQYDKCAELIEDDEAAFESCVADMYDVDADELVDDETPAETSEPQYDASKVSIASVGEALGCEPVLNSGSEDEYTCGEFLIVNFAVAAEADDYSWTEADAIYASEDWVSMGMGEKYFYAGNFISVFGTVKDIDAKMTALVEAA